MDIVDSLVEAASEQGFGEEDLRRLAEGLPGAVRQVPNRTRDEYVAELIVLQPAGQTSPRVRLGRTQICLVAAVHTLLHIFVVPNETVLGFLATLLSLFLPGTSTQRLNLEQAAVVWGLVELRDRGVSTPTTAEIVDRAASVLVEAGHPALSQDTGLSALHYLESMGSVTRLPLGALNPEWELVEWVTVKR